MKKQANIVHKGSDEQEVQYYRSLSARERLELVELLRERYIELFYATKPGFQSVYRIIRKTQS